jgi:hypothetical protein
MPPDSFGETSRPRATSRALASSLIIAPLLIGGVLYLGFRGDELLMFRAAHELGLRDEIAVLRRMLQPLRPHLPVWVIYSLPHALWTFSMLAFFAHVWAGMPAQKRAWTGGAVAVSAGSEVFQGLSLLPGTFSAADLAGIAAACAGWFILDRLLRPDAPRLSEFLPLPTAGTMESTP